MRGILENTITPDTEIRAIKSPIPSWITNIVAVVLFVLMIVYKMRINDETRTPRDTSTDAASQVLNAKGR